MESKFERNYYAKALRDTRKILRRNYADERPGLDPSFWQGVRNAFALGMLTGLIFISSCKLVHAQELSPVMGAMALIGEAEGESQTCRIAIAETIRRRGGFKGVYGLHAPRVVKHKYTANSMTLARAAWWDSRYTNYSKHADGWGNASDIVKFRKAKWFRNCSVVAHIDGTYFWKQGSSKPGTTRGSSAKTSQLRDGII